MVINCFYDENKEYADVIFIPDKIKNMEDIQKKFFDWLFDKNNDHKYWIIVNGDKKGCKYGTKAFIEWLNDVILFENIDKAFIVKENSKEWNSCNQCLIF